MSTDHLIALSRKAYDRLARRIAGLDDEEYHWEPAPVAWAVRTAPDGTTTFDFALRPMAPVPITTIAWRLTHIVDLLREDRCATVLGLAPEPDSNEVWIATSAADAIDNVDRAFATWIRYLEATDPARLFDAGEADRWPDRFTFALHIIDELIHHSAEVALLRDLYAATSPAATNTSVVELASRGFWDDAVRAVEAGGEVNPTGVPASPLHHAAGMGRLDLVRALLAHGADRDAVDDEFRVTPLVWAQFMGAHIGGPNAIGSDHAAVIEALSET